MKQSNIKTPLIFRIGVVLLCAMLLSCHMMSGLYARYSATVMDSDNARVAKFDVTTDCVYDDVTEEYTLTITNNSEVTVAYTVSYTIDGLALPAGVTISFGSNDNSGTLTQGANVSGTLRFNESYSEYHEEGIVDITVTVVQVD